MIISLGRDRTSYSVHDRSNHIRERLFLTGSERLLSIPAATHRSRSLFNAWAVIARMRVCTLRARSGLRIPFVAVKPAMIDIWKSISIRLNESDSRN